MFTSRAVYQWFGFTITITPPDRRISKTEAYVRALLGDEYYDKLGPRDAGLHHVTPVAPKPSARKPSRTKRNTRAITQGGTDASTRCARPGCNKTVPPQRKGTCCNACKQAVYRIKQKANKQ
jgi:hypothetical protein